MEQNQVPKLATRVYSKKPLGAYPEVDNSIIHDATATKPQERYLVLGEKFTGSLAAARALAADMLKVANRNIETHVDYEPATGWHHKGGPRCATKSDEGTIMNQATTQIEPTGKWLKAVNEMNTWVGANSRPADTETEALATWNKKHKQMQDRIAYHKGVALGTTKPRGSKAGVRKGPAKPAANKTSTANPAAVKPDAAPRAYQQQFKDAVLTGNINFGGVKMQIDSIDGLENVVMLIKKGIAK